jgi:hypothetical protein
LHKDIKTYFVLKYKDGNSARSFQINPLEQGRPIRSPRAIFCLHGLFNEPFLAS